MGRSNLFLGKFGSKKSKLSVFPENWHAWYLDDADSCSEILVLSYQKCFAATKTLTQDQDYI